MESGAEEVAVEAEMVSSGLKGRALTLVTQIRELPVQVIAVVALILIGGSGGAILYGD